MNTANILPAGNQKEWRSPWLYFPQWGSTDRPLR